MFVVVPNELSDEIARRLDSEIEKCPAAAADRDFLYRQLLAYYDEHGVIPDFTLNKKGE